jgi:hypothetical protein
MPETELSARGGTHAWCNTTARADGRFVVYATYAASDPTQLLVYRYNVATGNSTAMPAPDTGGHTPYSISALTVSANGRYIAFLTGWQDPADQGFVRQDVFVTDVTTRTTTSLGVGLLTADIDHQVQQPAISGDGTKVAFTTSASLTARDTNTHYDIYVHNMATGANELASRTVAGSTGNKQSTAPWISGDGRYVAFSSRSTNLAPGITDTTVTQAYLFDAQTDKTTLTTKTAAGVAGNGFAQALGISSTGRYVVFESAATDFGFPANPFGFTSWQIYRYDRVNDTIGLVSHAGDRTFRRTRARARWTRSSVPTGRTSPIPRRAGTWTRPPASRTSSARSISSRGPASCAPTTHLVPGVAGPTRG